MTHGAQEPACISDVFQSTHQIYAKEDLITSTHRGHGHCLGKGADPFKMFAELLGREDGYCRGRGGSMHIADLSNGNLGANGIVAGSLTISVGAALSFQMQKVKSFGFVKIDENKHRESCWSLEGEH